MEKLCNKKYANKIEWKNGKLINKKVFTKIYICCNCKKKNVTQLLQKMLKTSLIEIEIALHPPTQCSFHCIIRATFLLSFTSRLTLLDFIPRSGNETERIFQAYSAAR